MTEKLCLYRGRITTGRQWSGLPADIDEMAEFSGEIPGDGYAFRCALDGSNAEVYLDQDWVPIVPGQWLVRDEQCGEYIADPADIVPLGEYA